MLWARLPCTAWSKPTPVLTLRITQAINTGDYAAALKIIGQIAKNDGEKAHQNNEDYAALKVALLLYLGKAQLAEQVLSQARSQFPTGAALNALATLVHLTKGDVQQADVQILALTKSHPDHAGVLLARSYIKQAQFELEPALQSAQKANQIRLKFGQE